MVSYGSKHCKTPKQVLCTTDIYCQLKVWKVQAMLMVRERLVSNKNNPKHYDDDDDDLVRNLTIIYFMVSV